MPYETVDAVIAAMRAYGVTRLLVKPLPENDNAKNQIYFGKGYQVLSQLPFGNLSPQKDKGFNTVWASLDFYWLDDNGAAHAARHAKLILYPEYPEVRLSGMVRGCAAAPSEDLQPVPAVERRHNNAPDGRYLMFGISSSRRIYAVLARARSPLAVELGALLSAGTLKRDGVFYELSVPGGIEDALHDLLTLLSGIRATNPHQGQKLAGGVLRPYLAKNAGGYTLEALLGIDANGLGEPDFRGWEVKAYSTSRITLITPEPDGGDYKGMDFRGFISTYGYSSGDRWDFTGSHKAGVRHTKTGLTLGVDGFDPATGRITNQDSGGLKLTDPAGRLVVWWSFPDLIAHWNRKHSRAVYVPYKRRGDAVEFDYKSPALLGMGTDFGLFASALTTGCVVYDPGMWLRKTPVKGQNNHKKRSQFRIAKGNLRYLYNELREQPF